MYKYVDVYIYLRNIWSSVHTLCIHTHTDTDSDLDTDTDTDTDTHLESTEVPCHLRCNLSVFVFVFCVRSYHTAYTLKLQLECNWRTHSSCNLSATGVYTQVAA